MNLWHISTIATQLWAGLAIAAMLMAVLWLIERATKNAGVVDVGWSAGVGVVALFFGLTSTTDENSGGFFRACLVAGMLGFWSLRLALYLFFDRVWGRNEDGRYQTLRRNWGPRAGVYFFFFFEVQALLAWLFALPALIVIQATRATPDMPNPGIGGLDAWDMAGVAIWAVALIGEIIADRQLRRFRNDSANRGRTCRSGLWRYSRHPNYFFEWLHWWAYVVMAIGTPYGWLNLLQPALMLFFLFKVTGIPATEKQALESRGDDYRHYQRTTSAFVPWFPRKEPR